MNKAEQSWQNCDYVLGWFSDRTREARKKYREFLAKGIPLGMSTIQVARRLQISQPAASRLSKRGERIEKENQFSLIGKKA
jgi:hypothetical protein